MKIGIDCRLWNQSGVGRYTRNLVEGLIEVDRKNKYFLFCLTKDLQEIKQKTKEKVEIVPVNIRWHSLREQFQFLKILNKKQLDLVHFPYFSLPVFYKKPFIITIHDLIINHYSTGKASTLSPLFYKSKLLAYKYILKRAAEKSCKIISVSDATKEEIIEHLKVDPEKVKVIYEGVDEKIKLTKKEDLIKEPYFLYIGNAYPHKNLEKLIKAFKILTNDNENIKLVLVGKKDFFYKRIIEKEKDKNIIFFGEANDKELSNLYLSAKALVFPSLMEGFGLPLIEAMANDCLVICSDIPVFREIGKDAPVYFNPNSEKDIYKRMEDVLKNDYNWKVEKGKEIVKDYNWAKCARKTLEIYESCNSLRSGK